MARSTPEEELASANAAIYGTLIQRWQLLDKMKDTEMPPFRRTSPNRRARPMGSRLHASAAEVSLTHATLPFSLASGNSASLAHGGAQHLPYENQESFSCRQFLPNAQRTCHLTPSR